MAAPDLQVALWSVRPPDLMQVAAKFGKRQLRQSANDSGMSGVIQKHSAATGEFWAVLRAESPAYLAVLRGKLRERCYEVQELQPGAVPDALLRQLERKPVEVLPSADEIHSRQQQHQQQQKQQQQQRLRVPAQDKCDKAAREALGPEAARAKGELLLTICMKREDAEGALRLLSEGAYPDCVTESGWSPLMFASRDEKFNAVAGRLIAAGASLDLVDKDGWSALMNACINDCATIALLLIEAGAALDQISETHGTTALDNAFSEPAVAAAIRARGGRKGAELRVDRGKRDKAARAALGPAASRVKGEQLLLSCWRADAAAALQLIGEGADPDCVGGDGVTPLLFASKRGELDGVAARLVLAGAKLDLVDKDGKTALIWACIDKRPETALMLVEAGAALNQVVAEDGMTALAYASAKGLAVVADAIRKHGGR